MSDQVTIADGDVTIQIVPSRGALVSGLSVRGTEVLYLDPVTLADPAANVRGGIPVLFPFAGKLDHGTFALTGTRMNQHGFGRNKPWRITDGGSSWLRMALDADDDTRAQWPYEFVAEHTVRAIGNGMQLELTIVAGEQPLPVSPGWHPYFNIPLADKAKLRAIDGGGLPAAFSGAGGSRGVLEAPDFAPGTLTDDMEHDFGLVAPVLGRAHFDFPALGGVRLEFSPEMRHLQCWSQPGKPFVCLEPFYGPAGTVNTDARAWVPARSARTFWMRIELDDRPG